MFTQTWKIYLPVIGILIKRSTGGDQTLEMNHTDFERAAGGRKIKFSFSHLEINKGKLNTMIKQAIIGTDLATTLQEDDSTRSIIAEYNLEFSMTNSCILTIKNTTPSLADTPAPASEEESVPNDEEVESSAK